MNNEPKQQVPVHSHIGKKYKLVSCIGALDSFADALNSIDSRKRAKFDRAMRQQLTRFADGERMSSGSVRKEGKLPGVKGQPQPGNFYAFKRIPIRAYFWKSIRHPDTYFISHYIFKDFDDLNPNDTKRVQNNWRRIEESGDEH